MDETTQSELEKILRKFEDDVKEQSRKVEETKQEIERFQGEYTRVKRDVIKPSMEEVGTYIKKLGHEYGIIESEDKISMDIIPKMMNRIILDRPRISFDRWATEINIFKYPTFTSGASSQRVKIEDVTRSSVEQNILDVMKEWERKISNRYLD
jgi:preprotein translocase subunit Sss1